MADKKVVEASFSAIKENGCAVTGLPKYRSSSQLTNPFLRQDENAPKTSKRIRQIESVIRKLVVLDIVNIFTL